MYLWGRGRTQPGQRWGPRSDSGEEVRLVRKRKRCGKMVLAVFRETEKRFAKGKNRDRT